jgi:hypothetical protein
MKTQSHARLAVLAIMLIMPTTAIAQKQMVSVAPGVQYDAGSFHEWLAGSGHRDLWQTPVQVPVLNLARHAGGLKAVKQGGGRQTQTLHLKGKDGKSYVFRSVDKSLVQAIPPEFRSMGVEHILQDATALFNPTGALIVPRLLQAVSVLHAAPRLYWMADDPRLGEYRETFGGMLGYLEERPEEGKDDSAGFAGSDMVVGTDKLREHLLKDSRHRVAEREYLKARLIDFVVGDSDRGGNQWRWARFKLGEQYQWRPIPRDRDFALLHANGVLPRAAGTAFKRFVTFTDKLPSAHALTFASIENDRMFLHTLDASEWTRIVQEVQKRLTDDVIVAAVRALPPEHYALKGREFTENLRARRDGLPVAAREFYETVAEHVDVPGSDKDEYADARRHADGSVELLLYRRPPGVMAGGKGSKDWDEIGEYASQQPFYRRHFFPGETDEIRIYLNGGNDYAVVSGPNVRNAINVRIVGGDGDDQLFDSSSNGDGGTNTWMYDHEGAEDRMSGGRHTDFDYRDFTPPSKPDRTVILVENKRFRDWGETHGIAPALAFRDNTGFIVGVQYTDREFGFRRVPFQSLWRAKLMFAPGTGAFGGKLEGQRYFENSLWSLIGSLRASGYDDLRFYGYGNESARVDTDAARIEWANGYGMGGLQFENGGLRIAGGADMHVSDTPVDDGTPLDATRPLGIDNWTQLGAWTELANDFGEHGSIALAGIFHPAAFSLEESYGKTSGAAVVRIGRKPILALRAMGEKIWGDAPFQDAAFIGGRKLLRGYSAYRFAGDASLLGNAELRIPIIRRDVGVFLLGDAGRVYIDGNSPGGWHTAYGAGVWVGLAGHGIYATYANGEESKFYISLGPAF